jgi:hypothetical protein
MRRIIVVLLFLIFCERSALAQNPYSAFMKQNGSTMRVEVGATSEDAASVLIYFFRPHHRLSMEGVKRGTLFFDGTAYYEQGLLAGIARAFKYGCKPFTLEVQGSFDKARGLEKGFTLRVPLRRFQRSGCALDRSYLRRHETIEFKPAASESETRTSR